MFKNIKNDFPASIVVFFVALPLCLGIALASGAPPFAGMIAGIIGGIVVGALSGSQIGVSGPAAGLAAIVMTAISTLGSYEYFLVAVVLGGLIQIIFGLLRLGVIGYYFPSSVIKGMLVGIGIIIILKQIPHFFGYQGGDDITSTSNGILDNISLGATIIGATSLLLMLFWSNVLAKKAKIFTLIQGPFAAVVLGIIFYILTKDTTLGIASNHLVKVPIPDSLDSFLLQLKFPDFSAITNKTVIVTGFTIALVASLETLLCVEATDKIDPLKRITPTNRELFAQGIGNMVSGLIGGLPITQVIVRSSANIQSGGKSKLSAIIHGFLLLISVVLIPNILNKIPFAVLASILLIVGYKLANPATFKKMFSLGWKQWLPFSVTVIGIVFVDLLYGIALGLIVGIAIVLIKSYQNSHSLNQDNKNNDKNTVKITLAEQVTFFNKSAILKELENLPKNTYLELDVTKTTYLDNDIIEILEDFAIKAKERQINIKFMSSKGVYENPKQFLDIF